MQLGFDDEVQCGNRLYVILRAGVNFSGDLDWTYLCEPCQVFGCRSEKV